MLASIVLLVCLAAIAVAAGIVFIVFGPVPVNRRVTMVSRISAPMPTAAGPIAMPGMPVFDPAQATFTPVADEFSAERHAVFAAEPNPATAFPAERHAAAALEPPAPPPRKARPLAPLAPAQLRRPRTAPQPLPRVRSARGTEPRNPALPERDTAPHIARGRQPFEVEHTAQDIPMFEADEMTFVEDDRS